MFSDREAVASGGLMSFWVDQSEFFKRAAVFVDKILKGAKPEDLPVEQPAGFELVVNLKTAKDLGLTVPPSILARADRTKSCQRGGIFGSTIASVTRLANGSTASTADLVLEWGGGGRRIACGTGRPAVTFLALAKRE